MKKLAIVIPCYNEEEVLPQCVAELMRVLSQLFEKQLISQESALYFVDDGSTDATWSMIERYAETSPHIHGIKLSANRGHQHAILAGMLSIPCDMMVTIDADMQDDVDIIESMLRHHLQGAEIVYGVRNARGSDTAFKRLSAELYYRVLRWMGIKIIFNHADYRLLGRAALDALAQYGEVNLFLRGILSQLGFTTATVEYARKKRDAGTSKYPVTKMLALAWNGITSFSTAPLRAISVFGMVVAFTSFVMGIYALWEALFTNATIPGWTSTVVPLFFLGGIQLISIGIVGEYVGKIYFETKARPRFHIEKQV